MNIKNTIVRGGGGLLILLISFFNCLAEQTSNRPNIIFIMADDLGWVDVSTGQMNLGNGSTFHETPNIDRLASEGMSFTQAYTQQNCQPTRAALISGQFAPGHFNGVYNVGSLARGDSRTPGWPDLPIVPPDQQRNIDPAGLSIFEMMKSVGYRTSWFGKYHGTGMASALSIDHGVDDNFATGKVIQATVDGAQVSREYLALNDDSGGWMLPIPALASYAQPYDQAYIDHVLAPISNGSDLNLLIGTPKHMTDAIGDAVVDYIEERSLSAEPFFIYLPFHAVHVDTVSRLDLTDKYTRKKSTDPRHDNPEYAGFVELLDQNVGKVMRALNDPNGDGNTSDSITDNTLLIFYSDNGGDGRTDNSPLKEEKGRFSEGGIRVPLICRWPGVISAMTVRSQSVHCVDMFPTLAELAGAKLPDPNSQVVEGESFAPILRGETQNLDRENLFWHFPGYMDVRQVPNSVIQKRVNGEYFKLYYYYETGSYQLFNLTQDISETRDLLVGESKDEMELLAQQMNTDLRHWLIHSGAITGRWKLSAESVDYPPVNMNQ